MRLVVTRPRPESETLAETLRAAGHEPIIEPLLVIRPKEDVTLPRHGIDALVVTSANALQAIANRPEVGELARLPLYAVGPATARTARRLGFTKVIEGGGSATAMLPILISRLRPGTTLLHLAGDVVAVDLATPLSRAGITLHTAIVYEASESRALGRPLVTAIRQSEVDGVILMSPRTARTFVRLTSDAGVATEARRLIHFCISANTASALDELAPAVLRIAAKPDLPSLLALIDRESAQLPGRP
jgi:uroporphyrinogen-III synthase